MRRDMRQQLVWFSLNARLLNGGMRRDMRREQNQQWSPNAVFDQVWICAGYAPGCAPAGGKMLSLGASAARLLGALLGSSSFLDMRRDMRRI